MTSVPNRLLERQSELTVLDDCFASAAVGEGRLVVISGEAGVGKTALARELCANHRASAQVLWATPCTRRGRSAQCSTSPALQAETLRTSLTPTTGIVCSPSSLRRGPTPPRP